MSSVTPFFEAVKLESPPNIDMCSGQNIFLPIIMFSFRSKGTPTIRKEVAKVRDAPSRKRTFYYTGDDERTLHTGR